MTMTMTMIIVILAAETHKQLEPKTKCHNFRRREVKQKGICYEPETFIFILFMNVLKTQ